MENVENRVEMVENPTADPQTGEVIDYERLYYQASESVAELTAERDSLLSENTELRAARDAAIADGQKTKELNYTLARQLNIQIPHLCYLKGINEIAACRVCCVEVEGERAMVTACNNPVKEGMVVHTNSPRVRLTRRTNVELILSQHDCKCATCMRSGNCQLQTLANDLGIQKVRVVANKIRDEQDEAFIRSAIPAEDLLGCIHYNTQIMDADRNGKSPYDFSPEAIDEIRQIKAILDRD